MQVTDPAALISGLERLATVADRKAEVIETLYGPSDFDACELRDAAALLRLIIAALSEPPAVTLHNTVEGGVPTVHVYWTAPDGKAVKIAWSSMLVGPAALPPLPEPASRPPRETTMDDLTPEQMLALADQAEAETRQYHVPDPFKLLMIALTRYVVKNVPEKPATAREIYLKNRTAIQALNIPEMLVRYDSFHPEFAGAFKGDPK